MTRNIFNTGTMAAFTEEFEDTKGVIRIRKSKKDKQDNASLLCSMIVKIS